MIKYEINPKHAKKFTNFLKNIKEYFIKNNNTIHKARNEIKVIEYAQNKVVVKSFKIPHLLNRIVYSFFRKSKAKKSYEYSVKISKFVPNPIGFIEFYKGALLHQSYFVSEYFDYDFSIREPLLDKDFPKREAIFRAFARFTLELHNAHIVHNDYSPGNILIKKEDEKFIFKIVDINRMRFFELDEKARAKNFSKLWASDEVLEIISKEYCKYYYSQNFTKQLIHYTQKNKNFKNFKKRLKGVSVVD